MVLSRANRERSSSLGKAVFIGDRELATSNAVHKSHNVFNAALVVDRRERHGRNDLIKELPNLTYTIQVIYVRNLRVEPGELQCWILGIKSNVFTRCGKGVVVL